MRLLAEEAGQVIVTLNVTWLHNGVERVLTDSMTVQVGFVCACTHTHLPGFSFIPCGPQAKLEKPLRITWHDFLQTECFCAPNQCCQSTKGSICVSISSLSFCVFSVVRFLVPV